MPKTFATLVVLALALLSSMAIGSPVSAQEIAPPTLTQTVLDLGGGDEMRYAITVPAGYDGSPEDRRPLILALHPGGRSVYYGSWFLQSIVEPALRGWEAVIIAPDVPGRSWATGQSEQAILALIDEVLDTHAIDPARILVTGFSMGGRGTWYLAARHPDTFTGAVVMAGAPGEQSLDGLATVPIYVIHSPDDEVVPYAPVEEATLLLATRGYPAHLMRLDGASHTMMGDYIGPLRAAGDWVREQWRLGAPDR